MSNETDTPTELEFAVEFSPRSETDADLIEAFFADEEVFRASAFTGQETLTVIVSTTKTALTKLTSFIATHQQAYKNAKVKIGRDEISLEGYSIEDVEKILDRDSIKQHIEKINPQ